MFGWHHQLDVHEFEQALGVGDGQGNLVCCGPQGCKVSDMTLPTKVLLVRAMVSPVVMYGGELDYKES